MKQNTSSVTSNHKNRSGSRTVWMTKTVIRSMMLVYAEYIVCCSALNFLSMSRVLASLEFVLHKMKMLQSETSAITILTKIFPLSTKSTFCTPKEIVANSITHENRSTISLKGSSISPILRFTPTPAGVSVSWVPCKSETMPLSVFASPNEMRVRSKEASSSSRAC